MGEGGSSSRGRDGRQKEEMEGREERSDRKGEPDKTNE
jgi:hypothetical protein